MKHFLPHFLPRLALIASLILAPLAAHADQGSLCMPTSGTVSGLTFAQDVNAAFQALVTASSGTSAPTNPCGGVPVKGQIWLDTSTTPHVFKVYDGTSWQVQASVDQTNHIWTPPVGGGVATTLASSATTDLWSTPQGFLTVSGTTGIISFGGTTGVAGTIKFVIFSGILQITHNASSLILPTAANITTQAGDRAIVVNLGGGNTEVLQYQRADGSALSASSFSASIVFAGVISPTSLSGTTNDWAPSGLATAAVIRANASSSAIVTGLTAQPSNTFLIVQNINAATSITFNDADTGSIAANRFALGVNYVLGPQAAIQLRYDATLSRWVIASGALPASQAQATAGTDNAAFMTALRTAQAISALGSASNLQTFTTAGSATWTKPSAGNVAFVECWGAGGAGGRDSNGFRTGGGGGGGSYVASTFRLASLGATETVTVGAGGPALSADGNGSAGGNSSFGAWLTAYGGGGGSGNTSVDDAGGGGAGQGSVGGSSTGATGGTAGTDIVGGTAEGKGSVGSATHVAGLGAITGGGSGGGGTNSGGTQGGNGGPSGWGGGGGSGGATAGIGGQSKFGGNGAGSTSSAGAPGSQPGGGGSGGANPNNSGKGGDGECIVITY